MRKKLNKLTKTFITCLLVCITMLSTVQIKIKANITNLENTGYWHSGQAFNPANHLQTAWFDHQAIDKIHVDQGVGVCSEPWAVIGDWSGYVTSTVQEYEIASIWYNAYVNTGQSNWDYAVGQLMVWEYLGYKPTATNVTGYEARKAEINATIAKMNIKPSFNGQNITLNVGESITLTDTNNVLADFKGTQTLPTGITIARNGNTLTITASVDASDDSTYGLNKVVPNMVGQSIVHRKAGGQDIIYPLLEDPVSFKLGIHINKYGSLNITKQDEDGTIVPNTTFKLSKNSDMSSPVGTYTTGGNGSVLVNDLLPGTYYVQETVVPSHLVLDSTVHTVTIKPNETTSYVARNNWVKGKVLIRKTDTESGKQVAGATYAIFNNQNQELQRLVTTAIGYAESGYLRFGDYYVQEVIAPDGYVLNDTKYPVTISSNEQKIDVTGNDVRVKGSINITKEDSVTGNQPQGQGTSLAGAVYELKARNPILDPADKSVLFAKDAVVTTLTTDEQAKASVHDLYLGNYYLVGAKRFLISV